ncbi:MAG: sn-glycerol-3-phosphate ABC transporter ATP-binding protein UgpC [Candidatus Marinimicrobia bacterium]|nr:sn-glycerol-3-phosphate ABC transporter ATP-binding protein UgpC [Candidatus Neomarinimicrobiota bacterium]
MAHIELTNITKGFDSNKPVLENLNLFVNDGEFLVLVGPSGCGKSTTLRLIAGLETANSGNISIAGKSVNNIPPKNRDISMVFQNYALYPHMSVYDNMAFGLKLRKYSKDKIRERVNEAANILEITDLLNRKPKQLSGGQRQRVALGRAIVRKPKVFLFDEPLSNLDAKLRVQMRAEIKKLHKQLNTTMVYVTHDQVEAMTMGSRIAVMKDGVIHQLDTPLNIYNEPADLFVASFIGSPAMNFITTKVTNNHMLFSETTKITLPIPEKYQSQLNSQIDKEIVVGIRPEALAISSKSQTDYQFNATIELVEPLGNETILYLSKGPQSLTCISKQYDPQSHTESSIELFVDPDNIHLFDNSSTKRVVNNNGLVSNK